MKESLEKKYQYLARMINRVVNKKKKKKEIAKIKERNQT